MTVLVSDVSVLIDLEHGSLLEAAFRLPFKFVVPDVLYELELKAYNGPALLELGLIGHRSRHSLRRFGTGCARISRKKETAPHLFPTQGPPPRILPPIPDYRVRA